MAQKHLGIARSFAFVPTLDTERATLLRRGRGWTATALEIFGHSIEVDAVTGNLIIETEDASHSYYQQQLRIHRSYDAQEQWMQCLYLRHYPNVAPRLHWFGNWAFEFEAEVQEVWKTTKAEIQVFSQGGANGLFEIRGDRFLRNLDKRSVAEDAIRSFGIPGRTLRELNWRFCRGDFLLRSAMGEFQLLSGRYTTASLVDEQIADLWMFTPTSGKATRISSDYHFDIAGGPWRDIGWPTLITARADALGHVITLRPATVAPPYREYVLQDGAGRHCVLKCGHPFTYLDDRKAGRSCRAYLVDRAVDATESAPKEFAYTYQGSGHLDRVQYPPVAGAWSVKYHYDDNRFPGLLSAIEDGTGAVVRFEYEEDSTDLDERLNPRVKISRITAPEGIRFEYSHDYRQSRVAANVSRGGILDSNQTFTYDRDRGNTKRRFVTSTETQVTRGFVLDSTGNVAARAQPQVLRTITQYSADGRWNVTAVTDPLGRRRRYEYDSFNHVSREWDVDEHWTKYVRDIPSTPTPQDPIRWDVLSIEYENVLRSIDEIAAGRPFTQTVSVLKRVFEYDRYDAQNSSDPADFAVQSTHRLAKETDPRSKTWSFTYDDVGSHQPLQPTLSITPLGIQTRVAFNDLGLLVSRTDGESNVYNYTYSRAGDLATCTDPNGAVIALEYFPGRSWLKKYTDAAGSPTEFRRNADGSVRQMVGVLGEVTDYTYYANGRLRSVIAHRPAVLQVPTDLGSFTVDYASLPTVLSYSALGAVVAVKNPKDLTLKFEFDEAGRPTHWYQQSDPSKYTAYVYDGAGQLSAVRNPRNDVIRYTRFRVGYIREIQYPPWYDGINQQPSRTIRYQQYDYTGRALAFEDSQFPGTVNCAYDAAGNLVTRREHDGFELSFSFDDDNRLVAYADWGGDCDVLLTLDALGRARSLRDSPVLDGSFDWQFTYEKTTGGSKRVLNLFRCELSSVGLISEFDYDIKNRLAKISYSFGRAQPSLYAQAVSRLANDRPDMITGEDSNGFGYDALGQLIYESQVGFASDYDEAGNRLYRMNRAQHGAPGINIFNSFNQLKHDVHLGLDFAYDANGNVSSISGPESEIRYWFDGSGALRLLEVGTIRVAYDYDEVNRLVRRTVSRPETSRSVTRFRYALSEPVLIEEEGTRTAFLTWSMDRRLLRVRRGQQVTRTGAVNSLLALSDYRGVPTRLVDTETRTRVSTSRDAWGVLSSIYDPDGLWGGWLYGSAYRESVRPQVLFGARWYAPDIGRWLSADPLVGLDSTGLSDAAIRNSTNLYSFAFNCPTHYADPRGLQPTLPEGPTWFGVGLEFAGHAPFIWNGGQAGIHLFVGSNGELAFAFTPLWRTGPDVALEANIEAVLGKGELSSGPVVAAGIDTPSVIGGAGAAFAPGFVAASVEGGIGFGSGGYVAAGYSWVLKFSAPQFTPEGDRWRPKW